MWGLRQTTLLENLYVNSFVKSIPRPKWLNPRQSMVVILSGILWWVLLGMSRRESAGQYSSTPRCILPPLAVENGRTAKQTNRKPCQRQEVLCYVLILLVSLIICSWLSRSLFLPGLISHLVSLLTTILLWKLLKLVSCPAGLYFYLFKALVFSNYPVFIFFFWRDIFCTTGMNVDSILQGYTLIICFSNYWLFR